MNEPTEEQLMEVVNRLGDNEIYWEYDDELSNEQITDLIAGRVDDVEMEIVENNFEHLHDQREVAISNSLYDLRRKFLVTDEVEKRFRSLIDEHDKLLDSANLRDIAKKTEAYFVVVVKEPELNYQSWRGIETPGQADEINHLCEILNCNPAPMLDRLGDANYNDDIPLKLDDHPERDGNEYATTKMVGDCLREATYGGQLVFMCKMRVSDILDKTEEPQALRIHRGTLGIIYTFSNGAGSCPDIKLMKDLVLPPDIYDFDLDSNYLYGVQRCYGFTDETWKVGHVTFEEQNAIS